MKNDAHAELLRNLPALYESQTLDRLPQHLVDFIARLITCDALAYQEVNLRTYQSKMFLNRPELRNSPLTKVMEAYLHEHPLIRYQLQTGDQSARKISDFLSRQSFHATALYQEFYRLIGAEDQFAFSLQLSPRHVIALAMNRARRNFTEADRQFLNLLQPHLIQAYRNAAALTSLQHELRSFRGFLDHQALGLIILDGQARIQFASARARDLLKKYFRESPPGCQLPGTVAGWLKRACLWGGTALPNQAHEFSVPTDAGTLTIHRLKPESQAESWLRLEERDVPLSARPLASLGLTPRQAEVLLWVAQGKRNPEIATILGVASKTVEKHLESVFAKLGVESRTAAARRALEVLSAGGC